MGVKLEFRDRVRMKEEDICLQPNEFELYLFMKELKEFSNNSILFDGYFRAEAKLLPIRQLMYVRIPDTDKFDCHLITIDSKEVLEDTSGGGCYDEELGGYVCLTPTELIRIHYTILYTFKEGDEADMNAYKKVSEEIQNENQKRFQENRAYRLEREQKEYEEAVRNYVAPKF